MMTEPELNTSKKDLSLGLIQLPNNTFEHDLAVSSRYHSFSTELLRLSLLGIAAIGFLVGNILSKGISPSNYSPKVLLFISLTCFGLSALCALLHGYVSADTIARQLRSIRRELRRRDEDVHEIKKEKGKMKKSLRREIRLNIASGALLLLGAVALASSFIVML